jgi:PAS domain S-box-containing protein
MESMSVNDLLRFVHLAGSERSSAKVFAEMSRFIGEAVNARHVTVCVLEEGTFVPLVSERCSQPASERPTMQWCDASPLNGSALASMIETHRDVILIDDPETAFSASVVRDHEIGPLVATGLWIETNLLGALVVELDEEHLERSRDAIREASEFVALALANAQAFERERHRTDESEALLEVATVLTKSTEVNTVLASVARNSAAVTGFERCSILLLGEEGSLEPVMSQFADGHADPDLWSRFRSLQLDLPAARRVIDSGMPAAYTADQVTPDLIPPEWLTPFGVNSVLVVPLMVRGSSVGVMLLDGREHNTITPQQTRIAQAVAAHGAAAIGISRLLERESVSRHEAETALRSLRAREAQQAAMATLSQSAVNATDLDHLMMEAVVTLTTTLGVAFGKVLELRLDDGEFLLKAGVGWRDGLVGVARVDAGANSQAGFTMARSDPVIVEDLATDQRFSGPDLLTAHSIVSGMSVVIEGQERPYGVLGVHSDSRRTFNAEDISFLQAVANVLASAVDRQRGELALLEGERRLQAILDNASDAIISTDGDKIIVFNRQASRVFGYTPEEIIGRPIDVLVSEDFLARHPYGIKSFASGELTKRLLNKQIQLMGRRKNGEEFPAEITVSQIEVGGESVHTSIVRDVTERIATQQKIRESEERFRNLFERSPIAMWEEDFSDVGTWLDDLRDEGVEDLRGYLEHHPEILDRGIDLIRVRNVNPAAVKLIEADNAEQLLAGFRHDIRTDEVRNVFINQLTTIWDDHESAQFDFTATTYRGARIECVLHFAAGRSDDELDLSHVIVALADITERKAAEAQLRQIAQSKDELIASVSHEIRTPLTAVLGFAQLLRDEQGSLSEPERAEMFEALLTQSNDVANIVEDLLVAAKADIGKLHVVRVPVGLHAQVSQVLEGWDREIAARVHMDGDGVRCTADPARVRQIIRNLISNALRYGGPDVHVTVGERNMVGYIRVSDNGEGVAVEDSERIFEKYERGDQLPGLTGALGLGLALSRHLARLMSGDVTYERTDGLSVFEMTLPLVAR